MCWWFSDKATMDIFVNGTQVTDAMVKSIFLIYIIAYKSIIIFY